MINTDQSCTFTVHWILNFITRAPEFLFYLNTQTTMGPKSTDYLVVPTSYKSEKVTLTSNRLLLNIHISNLKLLLRSDLLQKLDKVEALVLQYNGL